MSSAENSCGDAPEELVTLILESGEKFEDIPLQDRELSLKEFLDTCLKTLEVSS